MSGAIRHRSSSIRHYAPSSLPPTSSTNIKPRKTLNNLSQEHSLAASKLPNPSSFPSSTPSSSSSTCPSYPPVPPSPRRKRRASALHAEASIRQQSTSHHSRAIASSPASSVSPASSSIDDVSTTSPLTTSSLSASPFPTPTAYITPEPKKGKRSRASKLSLPPSIPSSSSSPAVLPPLPPYSSYPSPPPLRRSTRVVRHLPKSLSSPTPSFPSLSPLFRSASLPPLHPSHPIFFDPTVLSLVLSFLPLPSFLSIRHLSSSILRASLSRHAWSSQHLVVTSPATLTSLTPSSLTGLTRITLNGTSFPDALQVDPLLSTVTLPSLTSLHLLNLTKLTHQGLLNLRSHLPPSLTSLTVQNCLALQSDALVPFTQSSSTPSSWHPSTLTHLDLTKYRLLNSQSLNPFSSFTSLSSLNLRGCREVNDQALTALESLGLVELDLSFCILVGDDGMRSLTRGRLGSTLRRLVLVSLNRLTDDGLSTVGSLALTDLDLSQCDHVTDRGITALTECSAFTLHRLALRWCPQLTGDTLIGMAEMRTAREAELDQWVSMTDSEGEEEGEVVEGVVVDEEYWDSDLDNGDVVEAQKEYRALVRRRRLRRKRRGRKGRGGREQWERLQHVDVTYCQGIDSGSKSVLIRARPELTLVWE